MAGAVECAGHLNVPTNAAAPEVDLRGHADINEILNVST
jgi:hypothetical protein